jgi:hypothetical protein
LGIYGKNDEDEYEAGGQREIEHLARSGICGTLYLQHKMQTRDIVAADQELDCVFDGIHRRVDLVMQKVNIDALFKVAALIERQNCIGLLVRDFRGPDPARNCLGSEDGPDYNGDLVEEIPAHGVNLQSDGAVAALDILKDNMNGNERHGLDGLNGNGRFSSRN